MLLWLDCGLQNSCDGTLILIAAALGECRSKGRVSAQEGSALRNEQKPVINGPEGRSVNSCTPPPPFLKLPFPQQDDTAKWSLIDVDRINIGLPRS